MHRPTASHARQIYEILLRENLDDEAAGWLNPLTTVHLSNGATMLTVPVRDQAELHGLFIKVRDLNLTLLAVRHVGNEQQHSAK